MPETKPDQSFWNRATFPFIHCDDPDLVDKMLQDVDTALQRYRASPSDNTIGNLVDAQRRWKQTEEDRLKAAAENPRTPWQKREEIRNLLPAINEWLDALVKDYEALDHWRGERKKVIELFRGKQVTFRNSKAAAKKSVEEAATEVETACKSLSIKRAPKKSSQGSGSQEFEANKIRIFEAKVGEKLRKMAAKLFQVENLETLSTVADFVKEIIEKCGKTVAPIMGQAIGGYEVVTEWANVGSKLHERYSISNRSYAIDTGSPAAAFDALKKCLEEETRREAATASAATAAFALKTTLTLVDGGTISGPVVGMAKAVANLFMKLSWFAAEWKATQGINKALQEGILDITLFRTYPLMGCYMLTSATLSDLIPIDPFGSPDWKNYVEKLKKEAFDDIYKSATKLIESSAFEIQGLPKHRIKGEGLQTKPLTTVASAGYAIASNIKQLFSK